MLGFLKAVLIGVAVYYVSGFILRILSPFLMRMFFRKISKKFEDQMKNKRGNKKQYKTQKKGKTIVEYEDEKEKKKDFGGDYVDYEELDKE